MINLPSNEELNHLLRAFTMNTKIADKPATQRPEAKSTSNLPPITPTIGRKVWFWPKCSYDYMFLNPQLVDPKQALDATIVCVKGLDCVNLLVIDHLGNQRALQNVTLRQPGCVTPAESYCEWMPCQQAQAASRPVEVEVAAEEPNKTDDTGVGACAGCGLCLGMDLASGPDQTSITMGMFLDALTDAPATDTLLISTLTAAHAAILEGDLTMAGQLVDAALGRIERGATK